MNTINWLEYPTFVPPGRGYFLVTRKTGLVHEAYWHDSQWWAVDWQSADWGYQEIDADDLVIAYAEFPEGFNETQTS